MYGPQSDVTHLRSTDGIWYEPLIVKGIPSPTPLTFTLSYAMPDKKTIHLWWCSQGPGIEYIVYRESGCNEKDTEEVRTRRTDIYFTGLCGRHAFYVSANGEISRAISITFEPTS